MGRGREKGIITKFLGLFGGKGKGGGYNHLILEVV